MPDPIFTVTLASGVVNLVYDDIRREELSAAVHEALDIQLTREGDDFTISVKRNRPAVTRAADEPHDFESESGAAEGGIGPCAVCGYGRGAPIHAPLPVFSAIMTDMLG